MKSKTTASERFWAKVDKTGSCWLWTGAVDRDGYGSFTAFFDGQKKFLRAHRFAYQLCKGEIAHGLFVCHSCDVPLCVNPDHLWLGTPADNVSDMLAKKRHLTRTDFSQCSRGHKTATDDWKRIQSPYSLTAGAGMHWKCRICLRENETARRERRRAALVVALQKAA